jgi:translation initiation factor 3 subunit E
VYPKHDLLKAKYELLCKTKLVEFTAEIYKQLHETDNLPQGNWTCCRVICIELLDNQQSVLQTAVQLQEAIEPVMAILQDPVVINSLRPDKAFNFQFLSEQYGFTQDMLNTLYHYGKFQYDRGNYGSAADMLYHFRVLNVDHEMNLSALWGKFAAEILSGNWEAAFEDLNKLKDMMETKGTFTSPLQQLQQRTWLIHWSLFVFFNHPKGRDGIIDLFLQPAYINTIQTACPWILRYLSCAVITNRRRRNQMKELVRIIRQESYAHSDPVTEFVEALYVDFDFDRAREKLLECQTVLSNDYFLLGTLEDFVESARFFIMEVYCRIHQKIDLNDISARLNMGHDEGEKWIVNLIRDTRVDAKIDFSENTINMNPTFSSIYQQVIEKTKGLAFKTQVMATKLDKKQQANARAAVQVE